MKKETIDQLERIGNIFWELFYIIGNISLLVAGIKSIIYALKTDFTLDYQFEMYLSMGIIGTLVGLIMGYFILLPIILVLFKIKEK